MFKAELSLEWYLFKAELSLEWHLFKANLSLEWYLFKAVVWLTATFCHKSGGTLVFMYIVFTRMPGESYRQ